MVSSFTSYFLSHLLLLDNQCEVSYPDAGIKLDDRDWQPTGEGEKKVEAAGGGARPGCGHTATSAKRNSFRQVVVAQKRHAAARQRLPVEAALDLSNLDQARGEDPGVHPPLPHGDAVAGLFPLQMDLAHGYTGEGIEALEVAQQYRDPVQEAIATQHVAQLMRDDRGQILVIQVADQIFIDDERGPAPADNAGAGPFPVVE